MERMANIEAILLSAFFGFTGFVGLFKPRALQRIVLKYYDNHPVRARINPMLPLIRTNAYILLMRGVGVFALLAFIAVAVMLYLNFTHAGID